MYKIKDEFINNVVVYSTGVSIELKKNTSQKLLNKLFKQNHPGIYFEEKKIEKQEDE